VGQLLEMALTSSRDSKFRVLTDVGEGEHTSDPRYMNRNVHDYDRNKWNAADLWNTSTTWALTASPLPPPICRWLASAPHRPRLNAVSP